MVLCTLNVMIFSLRDYSKNNLLTHYFACELVVESFCPLSCTGFQQGDHKSLHLFHGCGNLDYLFSVLIDLSTTGVYYYSNIALRQSDHKVKQLMMFKTLTYEYTNVLRQLPDKHYTQAIYSYVHMVCSFKIFVLFW